MEREEKIKYLKRYNVFGIKIQRLNEMIGLFPERKKEYQEEIEKTQKEIIKIEREIKSVDDGLLSEILFQKYILCRSLDVISVEINYSKRQVERLHLIALDNFCAKKSHSL